MEVLTQEAGRDRDCLAGKEQAEEDVISVYKYLKREFEEEEARISSVVPNDRPRGKGHKPKHRRLPLNIRKNFFYCAFVQLSTGTG